MKKGERKRYGKYEVRFHPGGGFSVFGAEIRNRGFYVPSDIRIRERYKKDGETSGIITVLAYRAIPYCGKRSVPDGRAALGLPYIDRNLVHKDEIVSAIKGFWKPEIVYRFMAGEDIRMPNITDFRKENEKNERAYHAAQRKRIFRQQGGFEGIMQEVYSGLYQRINRKTQVDNINREHLGKILLSRFYSGLPLSKTSFLITQDKNERKLLRQVEALGRSNLFRKPSSYTKTVIKLTGLRRDDITDSRIGKDNSKLTEELTDVFFNWAFLAGLEIGDFIKKGEVCRSGEMVKFSYGEKEGRADLRIGNQAVEVKTGIGFFGAQVISHLIEKYSKGKQQWYSGEPLDRSLAIFHQRKEMYEGALGAIEEAGIKIMSYEQFHSCLIELVGLMKKNFQDKINSIKPRIHNLDYIIDLHEEISLKPCVLMRKGNYDRMEWSHNLLKSLAGMVRDAR